MSTKRVIRLSSLLLVAASALVLLTVRTNIGPRSTHAVVAEMVPVELVLLVDTSGSVDAAEYELQRDGYVDAFRDPAVGQLIEQVGGIVVVYIEWSNTDHQSVRVPWTRLDTAADCNAFATQIGLVTREASGETMLAPALEFALNELQTNGYNSLKRVIDVSGDGRCENWEFHSLGETTDGHTDPAFYGTAWDDVVSSATGKVNQINGICIGTDADLVDFYTNVLPQGGGAFMMQVDDFWEFGDAIKQKLQREITAVPGLFD